RAPQQGGRRPDAGAARARQRQLQRVAGLHLGQLRWQRGVAAVLATDGGEAQLGALGAERDRMVDRLAGTGAAVDRAEQALEAGLIGESDAHDPNLGPSAPQSIGETPNSP